MAKSISLAGKVVLVTGAARGIGAGVAEAAHAAGARVALVGLEPDKLRALAERLGDRARWFAADVTDAAAIARAVDDAAKAFGGLDVVFANAGIGAFGAVATIDPAQFERVVEVNFFGVWRTMRAALPHLVASRGYALINASVAAAFPAPGMAAYAASKAAAESFGDALRAEMRHRGVTVGVAYLSWIDTDLVQMAEAHEGFRRLRAKLPGPFGVTIPVAEAVRQLLRGIQRRDERILVPPSLLAFLPLRWLVARLGSRTGAGQVIEELSAKMIREYGGAAAVPTSEPPRS